MAKLFKRPYQKGRRYGSFVAGLMIDAVDRGMDPLEAFRKIWSNRAIRKEQSWKLGEPDGARRRLEIVGRRVIRMQGPEASGPMALMFLMIGNGGAVPSGHDMLQLISEWGPKSRKRRISAPAATLN